MKISAFVALAGVSAQAPAGRIFFDEDLPCDDFDAKFPPSDFPDMKTKCKTKHNKKKNKTKNGKKLHAAASDEVGRQSLV